MTSLGGRAAGALAVAVGLLGCGKPDPATAPDPDGPPQRIVSQTIFSDEVLLELGDEVRSRVVAVSALVDDPAYSTVANRWPKSVPRAPMTSETVLAARAELVIIADFTAVETRELLERTQIPLLMLAGFSGFADFRTNARAIGEAVGQAKAGQELVERFDTELAKRSSDAAGGLATVSWAAGNVAGTGTTFDDVAKAAGLTNVAARNDIAGHKPVAVEQLVVWDPQMLVVPCPTGRTCTEVAAEVRAQPGIAATRAARSDCVLAMPSAILYSSGWAMLDAVDALTKAAASCRRGEATQ